MSSKELLDEIRRLPLSERVDLMTQIAQSLREELTPTEAELLRKINEGMRADFWERYHKLLEKRRAETLTQEEQKELIECSDRIEIMNARRIEYLAELARLRGVNLSVLMEQLGIAERSHD